MVATWVYSYSPGEAVKVSLFLRNSCGQNEDLMVKTTPIPDVVDDNNNHYAAPLQIPPPRTMRYQG
jgi:hypothetical protein